MRFRPSFKSIIPDIVDKEFDQVIGKQKNPVLVEFWKPGCPHCQSLLRELELLQGEIADYLKIFKMNVEDNPIIPADLEIVSLPALALFVNGDFLQFIGGIGKKSELIKTLAPWLSSPPTA